MGLHNPPPVLAFRLLSIVQEAGNLIRQDVGDGKEIVMTRVFAFHFRKILEHEIFASDLMRFGEVINFHISPHALIYCWIYNSYVP